MAERPRHQSRSSGSPQRSNGNSRASGQRPEQRRPAKRRKDVRGPRHESGGRIPPPPTIPDEVRVERVVDEKPRRKKGSKSSSQVDVSDVDFSDVPAATATKLQRRLAEAARAFEADRFPQADQLLGSIDRLAPGVPEVLELRGLTSYRLGHWVRALNDLDRFAEITGSVEQNPVRADCCRALKRWARAGELWAELAEVSPSAELVEEGRIVQAGMLADRGHLDDAIRFLEKARSPRRNPGPHHLRRWYALGDLYERTGDLARARRYFTDILEAEPGFGDVPERLANLA